MHGLDRTWWSVPAERLAERIGTDLDTGLSSEQVEANRETYGTNKLDDAGPTGLWTLAWESIRSPMMLLLLAVAAISLVVGRLREAIVMAFVVATYVGVHLLNKARSDRTMARLREVQAPSTRALREGRVVQVYTREVVVGDVLPLEAGTRVPADGRLLSAVGLLVDEAPLTGESAPIRKDPDVEVGPDADLAERRTAVFGGTSVVDGQGRALVVAVGAATQLGKIAQLTARAGEEPTPLQEEMDDLARTLAFVAIGVSLLIPALGLVRGYDLQEMVLTWLSLTFLMVPGQPPIIIAMALALASLELARKEVTVRRLHGAETLSAVTVLLSDKTGTMTQNEMTLSGVLLPDGRFVKTAKPDGAIPQGAQEFFRLALPAIPQQTSDPTDWAVARAARAEGQNEYPNEGQLVDRIDIARTDAYRLLQYQLGSGRRSFLAGRPEYLVNKSERQAASGQAVAWQQEERDRVVAKARSLGAEGKRITGYAFSDSEVERGEEPRDLVFVGAAVISDPIRPEVPEAVARLSEAGIGVRMVTGDIPETAAHVAHEIGLDGSDPVTGNDLDRMASSEIAQVVSTKRVFARTTPEQKMHLVEALIAQDDIVAVTGDGINDAPALRKAHVGIAMGQIGTDVAKAAADLVLNDDDFARLPDAVAIARKAYDNFAKGITYYLSAKAILVAIFVVPLVVGVPFPLAPIQIIVTELLMDLASSTIFLTEEAEPKLLKRGPRRGRRYLSWDMAGRIARNSAGLTFSILGVYLVSLLALDYGVEQARTAAFATWLLGHILLALNLKQRHTPLIEQGFLANRFGLSWLIGMSALVCVMTLVAPARSVLKTSRLDVIQWALVAGGAAGGSFWLEVAKWLRRDTLRH